MRLVVADFETFWSQTHSLSKMNPVDYVLHPDTEVISLAIKYDGAPAQVFFGEGEIQAHLDEQDWSDVMLVGHNMSAFDAMIFAWRFGVSPKVWGCTLAMARPIHSKTTGNSLGALVKYYELGEKDNTALVNTKGKHLADFTPEEIEGMRTYNRDDTDQCYGLFRVLRKHYNAAELWQIDATIRMLVEPKFILNRRMLDGALTEERIRKQQSLEAMAEMLYGETPEDMEPEDLQELVRAELASAPKFANLLKSRKVPVPMKPSPSNPEKKIPALSKTDEAFLALQEHEDEVVAMAAAARLDVKSTILQTRLETFLSVGKKTRGRLPIPLHYCGADTTGRWCLTPDHEVLTKNGWVRLDEWSGQPIMQWSADSGGMQWCETTRVTSFPTDEKLVQFDSDYHRAVYTQEHRVPCKTHRGNKYVSVTAGKLATLKRRAMAVSGAAETPPVHVPSVHIRLIVAMHADGYNVQDDKNNMVRFRFTKGRKVERIKELLFLASIPYTVHNYPSEPHVSVVIICGKHAPDWLRSAKTLPDWFYQLNAKQGAVVLEELQHWDGGSTGPESFEWRGVDEDAATKYATIAHLCGHRAKVTLRERTDEGWSPNYRISFCPQTTYHVLGEHATRVDYKGLVFCPTVDSGFFLCRRQNTIFVTGNSGFMYNPQNLPRINPDKPKPSDALRKSMRAPVGHKIVVADLSGIELRVNHFLWKVPSSMALYRASPDKADLYKEFAAKLYNTPLASVSKEQRQIGKVAHLGLGFGAGPGAFQKVAKTMGGVDLDQREAEKVTYRWRDEHPEIVQGWRTCHSMLRNIAIGDTYEVDPWGLVHTEKNALVLPSGRRIRYPGLHIEEGDSGRDEWWYGSKRTRARIYAGKIDENIVQALARDIIAEQAFAVYRALKIRPSLMVHDELVYVVPEDQAQDVLDTVQEIMRTPPKWWPQLITWSEGDIADSYGEAK